LTDSGKDVIKNEMSRLEELLINGKKVMNND